MNEQAFIIKRRFEVRPTANSVTDTVLQKEMKVEPRLMKLLCILARQPGELVKRDQLVSEIWNDYGGAEAGLNHAISSLRKLLNDTSKELIETIPTKGYIMHAEVDELQTATNVRGTVPGRSAKRVALYASVVLLTAVIAYSVLEFRAGDDKEVGSLTTTDLNVPFDQVSGKTEETWLNTIVTVGHDSTEYKLKVIGDRRPEFFVNGRLISPDEMEQHLDLISKLKQQLGERAKNR